jgi:2-polyprenyl-3-methyl-5-hydroxy-6-metoxy-1,4-benzoquinol methylase
MLSTASRPSPHAARLLDALAADAPLVPPALSGWWRNYLHAQRGRYLDVVALLRAELGESRGETAVLEVGSVPGHLTILLRQLGYAVQGVDLAPERLAALWQKYDLSVARVDVETQPLPFAAGAFDLVLCNEVLEHLRVNPLYALREMARVLRPGGRLLLSTPNITLLDRLKFLLGRSYQGDPVTEFQKLEWLGHMGHIRLYERREVVAMLRAAGLTVTAAQTRGAYVARSWRTWPLRLLPWRDRLRPYLYLWAVRQEARRAPP